LLHYNLFAFDGRTGEQLWKRSFNGGDASFAVADPDGDGLSEVVGCGIEKDAGGDINAVVVFNGKDGQPRWAWTEDNPLLAWQLPGFRREPVLLRRGPDTAIALQLSPLMHDRLLVLLDARGRVLQRRLIPRRGRLMDPPRPLRSYDLNGDGRDELLFFEGDKLVATRGDFRHVLWRSPLSFPAGEIREFLPGAKGQPATVVVRSGESLYGLNGRTGGVRWRHDGAGEVLGLMPGNDSWGGPRILCSVNKQFVSCRLALTTIPSGDYRPPAVGETVSPVKEVLPPRPLPWESPFASSDRWFDKAGLGHPMLPFLCFWVFLVGVAIKGGWRGLGVFLMWYILLTLLVVGITLGLDSRKMEPGERYSGEGWYSIFLITAIGGGFASLVVLFDGVKQLAYPWCRAAAAAIGLFYALGSLDVLGENLFMWLFIPGGALAVWWVSRKTSSAG
jgi:hypothetical protein